MLILDLVLVLFLQETIGQKYYYKEKGGQYDIYYGPKAIGSYKEIQSPKSFKSKHQSKAVRPGKCMLGKFYCEEPFPVNATRVFECHLDYQCPQYYKCCKLHCFRHKICQPSTAISQDWKSLNLEFVTEPSLTSLQASSTTDYPTATLQTTNLSTYRSEDTTSNTASYQYPTKSNPVTPFTQRTTYAQTTNDDFKFPIQRLYESTLDEMPKATERLTTERYPNTTNNFSLTSSTAKIADRQERVTTARISSFNTKSVATTPKSATEVKMVTEETTEAKLLATIISTTNEIEEPTQSTQPPKQINTKYVTSDDEDLEEGSSDLGDDYYSLLDEYNENLKRSSTSKTIVAEPTDTILASVSTTVKRIDFKSSTTIMDSTKLLLSSYITTVNPNTLTNKEDAGNGDDEADINYEMTSRPSHRPQHTTTLFGNTGTSTESNIASEDKAISEFDYYDLDADHTKELEAIYGEFVTETTTMRSSNHDRNLSTAKSIGESNKEPSVIENLMRSTVKYSQDSTATTASDDYETSIENLEDIYGDFVTDQTPSTADVSITKIPHSHEEKEYEHSGNNGIEDGSGDFPDDLEEDSISTEYSGDKQDEKDDTVFDETRKNGTDDFIFEDPSNGMNPSNDSDKVSVSNITQNIPSEKDKHNISQPVEGSGANTNNDDDEDNLKYSGDKPIDDEDYREEYGDFEVEGSTTLLDETSTVEGIINYTQNQIDGSGTASNSDGPTSPVTATSIVIGNDHDQNTGDGEIGSFDNTSSNKAELSTVSQESNKEPKKNKHSISQPVEGSGADTNNDDDGENLKGSGDKPIDDEDYREEYGDFEVEDVTMELGEISSVEETINNTQNQSIGSGTTTDWPTSLVTETYIVTESHYDQNTDDEEIGSSDNMSSNKVELSTVAQDTKKGSGSHGTTVTQVSSSDKEDKENYNKPVQISETMKNVTDLNSTTVSVIPVTNDDKILVTNNDDEDYFESSGDGTSFSGSGRGDFSSEVGIEPATN